LTNVYGNLMSLTLILDNDILTVRSKSNVSDLIC